MTPITTICTLLQLRVLYSEAINLDPVGFSNYSNDEYILFYHLPGSNDHLYRSNGKIDIVIS